MKTDNRSPLTADELAQLVIMALREEAKDMWDRAAYNSEPIQDKVGDSLSRLADKLETSIALLNGETK